MLVSVGYKLLYDPEMSLRASEGEQSAENHAVSCPFCDFSVY